MNLSYLYLLHSQPSVVRGLWEGRFDSKVVGTQVGSEAHQEPSPQRRSFYWEVLWLVFCFPYLQHLERAFDSIVPFSWTTRIGSTNEWGFCHPQKSCLDHLKAKAALWENPGDEGTPRLKLGEAAATYAGTNVLVGPGVTSRQRSHPPRHVSPLCGAEEGGGGELNC